MSNLSTAVVFDVLRGWPNGAAIAENFSPEAAALVPGAELLEGQIVEHNGVAAPNDGLQLPVGNVAAAGVAPTLGLYMVIQGNDQSDAQMSGQITVLRGEFTVRTLKVEQAVQALTVGQPVSYNANGNIDVAGVSLVIGYVEEVWDATTGVVVALSI
jgi:hypothetical protein